VGVSVDNFTTPLRDNNISLLVSQSSDSLNPTLCTRKLSDIHSELDRRDATVTSFAAFVNTAYLIEKPISYKKALQSSNYFNWQ